MGHGQMARRREVPSGTAAPLLHTCAPAPKARSRVKGGKYSAFRGPWASAADSMPPKPLTGARRAQAGLGDVDLPVAEIHAVECERAARALVALLPWGSASYILDDSPALVLAREPAATAALMVATLSTYGASSLNGALSALGRLLEFSSHHSELVGTEVSGSTVTAFMRGLPSTGSVSNDLKWLRDWCGVNVPARGPSMRPFRGQHSVSSNNKLTFSPAIVMGLELIATHNPCPFVRGHAAGWYAIAMCVLRLEQASSVAINCVHEHVYDRGGPEEETFRILCASALRDKHPNPAKQRPRPVWGIIDGVSDAGAVTSALFDMLRGAESVRCLVLDTDSPGPDPLSSPTAWVRNPLVRGRAEASLHALLVLVGLTPSAARRYKGHSGKRFMLSLIDDSPVFDTTDAQEAGRFSHSSAQDPDLEPVAAMLRAHTLASSALPAIYAGQVRVLKHFDRLCRLQIELRRAASVLRTIPPESLDIEGGWASGGLLARAHADTGILRLTGPSPE